MAAFMDLNDETSDDGEIFYLLFYYLTLTTEQRIQSLDYDFGNFLVAGYIFTTFHFGSNLQMGSRS